MVDGTYTLSPLYAVNMIELACDLALDDRAQEIFLRREIAVKRRLRPADSLGKSGHRTAVVPVFLEQLGCDAHDLVALFFGPDPGNF